MDEAPESRTWAESAEQERKEIFQHFVPDGTFRSASDATLSAFAQLAAWRLNASHALISLLDGANQYVLVEATWSSRLRPNNRPATDEDEGFLLGRTTLPRPLGLCGFALDKMEQHGPERAGSKLGRPSSVPFVVGDVAANEELRSHPFVASHPSVRFYATMPICTASGLPVGALSVLDERPRKGLLGADEIAFLGDVGPSIMAHLETTRISDGHRRGDKMIKGLGVFMEGRMELCDWWCELGDARHRTWSQQRPVRARAHDDSTIKVEAAPPNSESAGGLQVTGQLLVTTPLEYTTAREPSPSEGPAQSPPPSRGQSSRSFGPGAMDGPRPIPKMLSEMLSRAAHIIQEAIDVDGALFLDARVSTPSERSESVTPSERGPGSSRSSTNPSESSARGRGGGDAQEQEQEQEKERAQVQVPCRVLSLWTSERSSLHGDKASWLRPVTESFLLGLLNRYPQGHVFNPGEAREQRGHGKEETAAATLGAMLPGARSVVVVPLWDASGGRWFAAGCMWTVNPTDRVLTRGGDLNYLAAFGNSIMAEVARLDVVRTDLAKSDFISSISHELRSPLHGILASAELLHDTTLDLFQRGMIDTVERCGRTLLDTIQHVLDFAKINNFLKHGSLGNMSNLSVDVNLSLLTEDVVDSVFAGHEFQSEGNKASTPFATADEASGGFPAEALHRKSSAGDRAQSSSNKPQKVLLDVILDVGWRPNWFFRTESGAVRRVLMNLFGNALKYTDRGWIRVSLQAKDMDATKSTITITVADSGRGIDPEYLHGALFTPFTQENPLNPGTGLGLSIVLQIVRSLRGRISITSEPGLGTQVVVTLVLNQVPLPQGGREPRQCATKNQEAIQNARDKAGGLSVGLLGFDATSPDEVGGRHGERNVRAGRELSPSLLRESIESTTTQWFGMEVTTPCSWPSSPPDIYIANERAYIHDASPGVPIIALCSHEELYREYSRRTARGDRHAASQLNHFVSKPCGPHKLAEALDFCLSMPSRSSATTSPSTGPGPNTATIGSPQNSLFAQTPDNYGMNEGRVEGSYFSCMTAVAETLTQQAAAAATARRSNSLPTGRTPRLLLVEDNKINLRLLSTFIGRCPFDYSTAENGLEAVQAFDAATPSYDIIIMDISMPIMDGMEATRQIRKLEQAQPQKQPTMIIALTGLGSANSQKDAFGSGVDMFLTKPVRLKDLRKILDDWVPDGVT